MAEPGTSVAYSEHYKTVCKAFWYSLGRPDKMAQFAKDVPPDEFGRKVGYETLKAWRQEFLWDAWADSLDAEAEKVVEDELVNQRIIMLRKQSALGAELQIKAIEHLRSSGFDTSASAVSAIKLGVDIERTSKGISDRLVRLTKMTDEELSGEAQKLLERAMESGEIIDAAEVPNTEEKIDAEV